MCKNNMTTHRQTRRPGIAYMHWFHPLCFCRELVYSQRYLFISEPAAKNAITNRLSSAAGTRDTNYGVSYSKKRLQRRTDATRTSCTEILAKLYGT